MKKLLYLLLLIPLAITANDKKTPSAIKEVTVYLNGAQITRTSNFALNEGTTELKFTGLSPKIDENSIQISGLKSVSILSMDYGINYLDKFMLMPEATAMIENTKKLTEEIELLKNRISGLQEEELLISKNRLVSSTSESLDLEKLKQISTYYRKRITEIRDEIFTINKEIATKNTAIRDLNLQVKELTSGPAVAQGELVITFDTAIAINLDLVLSYIVSDAGWVPTYDIKSENTNSNLQLKYKANVYQNTGNEWKNVKINLSTGNPVKQTTSPVIDIKYLNFVSGYNYQSKAIKKNKYYYNPSVKKVTGIVTDVSGQPLPGCNVLIKGTNIGTQTDFDGNYTIAIQRGQELVFSYIGMQTAETPIYASIINTKLDEDNEALEEVVVTGYATELQGKVAGVRIRGASSISEPKLPLYIVDGIPMPDFTEGDIDTNDIQSLEVLNSSKATAVYGSRASNGVIVITTKKSTTEDDVTNTTFAIKKPYSIKSDGDLIAIEINTFKLETTYQYLAIPIINENVFLTASFKNWEQYNLLPGEANIYFKGGFAGKTIIDPYKTTKEMVVSLGIDAGITVTRKQDRNFKSKSFLGNNRVLNRAYDIEIKNNKNAAVTIKLMDRIPLSENKEIKVSEIETYNANYNDTKGLLTWEVNLNSKETQKERFSYQVKFPKNKHISL
ncbi:mucoidy inhibitor MuiA family protein [Cellulophaga fucicola]|uniref:mucoidy inhibitor MuiA family protein n=1 Tax=Cellulophaga fucicola TaxID=76595 RepID=UPI003EBDACBE